MAKVRLLDPNDSKRRLDRYELIGELASGGMATVFLGRLGGVGGFQRFVAIKRLHPHLASEEEFIEMFLDEARLAAGIHHPHVVPILEVGESDSGYYLVMEYIEGDTLARLMARALARAQPIPRPVLIRIVLDALAGLHAAHELLDPHGDPVHLVHRDVSPQNVLVGVDGCSRITDFGVAHAASRLQNTRADRLKGKLAYMSPEQARAGDVDQRADVFAMGTILWEVLAGKRLFKGESEAMTLQRVTIDPIPRLAAVVQGMHPALDLVCNKALERDPDRRYRTAADMAEALERAARAAANASATDLGVASPREVAAYVQGALGEDIAAQRESVRAWLAHSEPSLPRAPGAKSSDAGKLFGDGGSAAKAASLQTARPGYDVTVKMPLDRPTPTPTSAPIAQDASWDVAPSPAPAEPPATRREARTTPDVMAALGIPSTTAEPDDLDETPCEPRDDDADDEEEHETLLMDRDATAAAVALLVKKKVLPPPRATAPQSRPSYTEEGTPSASIESFMVPAPPPPNRTPQLVALVVGVLIAVGGVVMWWQLSAEQVPKPPPTVAAPGSTGPAAVSVSAAPSATPVVPRTTAAVEAAPVPVSGLADAGLAPAPRVKGPMPRPRGSAAPSAKPAAQTGAPWPAPAPEPAKPPDDLTNPYRQ